MSGRPTPRELWVALETVHAVTYFAPSSRTALREAGLRGFWQGYFASRAAPLGPIGAAPVAAAFYNFHPGMVARAVPDCWSIVTPGALCARRASAAATALGELCSTGARTGLVAALPLMRRASAACDGAGRVMAGANRSLWPAVRSDGDGVAEAWQCCTTLREHRGDGHVAALLAAGLDGLQAHVLAAGAKAVPPEVLRDNRGWSEEDWAGAVGDLASRGLLYGDGRLTDEGRTLHGAVEARTDRLAEPAYREQSDSALADLLGALRACAAEVAASGIVPYPNPMGLPPA